MTNRKHVAATCEKMRLAKGDPALDHLRRASDDKERFAILLDLRLLVRLAGILDGQCVKIELSLQAQQDLVARFKQADPDDMARPARPFAGFIDRNVGDAASAGIDICCNDAGLGFGISRQHRPPPLPQQFSRLST